MQKTRSPSKVNLYMNNLNSQYTVRNFLQKMPNSQNQPQFVHQDPKSHASFHRIQNVIAAASESRNPQPHMITPTPTSQKSHPREPTNILSKCAVCPKMANFLCSRCKNVCYCTVTCQVRFVKRLYISILFYFAEQSLADSLQEVSHSRS